MTPEKLLQIAPHVDPRIAQEWLGSVANVVDREVRATENCATETEIHERIASRMRWYAHMMGGFSGSDIGTLFIEYQGGFSPFGANAADVIKEKLGLNVPDPSFGDIERGRLLKPVARRKFEQQMQHLGLKPYPEGLEAYRAHWREGGDPDHPWIAGEPDTLYRDANGETHLVYFSVPRTHDSCLNMQDFPSDYHKAHLALYKHALERAGVTIDHTTICPLSVQNMEIYPVEVVIGAELQQEVLAAGDFYWEHVERQQTPGFTPRNRLEEVSFEDLPADLKKQASRFVYLKRVESQINKQTKGLKTHLLDALREHGVAYEELGKKTRVPMLDISMREQRRFNEKKAKAYISELGGDPDDWRIYDRNVFPLCEVTRKKTGADAEDVATINDIATRVVSEGEMDLAEEIGFEGLDHAEDTRDPRDQAPELDARDPSANASEPNPS